MVRVKKMDNLSCDVFYTRKEFRLRTFSWSCFIDTLFESYEHKTKQLVPSCIISYWEAIQRLHTTKAQPLANSSEWLYNMDVSECEKITQPVDYKFGVYDEFDADLCIAFLDRHEYRATLAICMEMYLRRQLKVYHYIITQIRAKKIGWREQIPELNLPLPYLWTTSNNPDDVRRMDIVIDKEKIEMKPKFEKCIPAITIEKLGRWWCRADKSMEKFRCRSALLNPMDCMQLLFESSEHVSNDLIAKIAYHLRPFRFVLPLTFLFDIFGGVHSATDIIENNFPSNKCRAFPDRLLLMDEKERIFAHNSYTINRVFMDAVVKWQHRVNAFLSGGFLAYILGLTNNYNDIDIYIEYNSKIVKWISQLNDVTRPRGERRIWIQSQDILRYDPNGPENIDSLWDGSFLFRNCKQVWVHTRDVYKLNESNPMVQHWMLKYGGKNLPRIILYAAELSLGNYTILKLISGFDIPICRNALVFRHTIAYHLREFVLTKFYGCENIALRNFVDGWKKDELEKIDRISSKVTMQGGKISPPIRKYMYLNDRKNTFKNQKELEKFLKYRRQIVLIRFPFDSAPFFDHAQECGAKSERIEKYQLRICENGPVDYFGNKTLPLSVYPLKYLAYWKLMALEENHNVYNCLCNFNFLNKKNNPSEIDFDPNNEPVPSTSTSI